MTPVERAAILTKQSHALLARSPHNAIEAGRGDSDFVCIDTPPSVGLLTVNALTAADKVIVPVQAEYLALEHRS